ncbi:hypothetical protein [Sulfuriroseicoccus oceanibius]|uniref:Macrodomain effector MavL domain-containing protein n=1 Tax=Sulfuriroseicoccus oceanibius TaxID=2707525 RepID=A0A6B3L2M8_9BACT|nr:hypothetical protein [Sulfuriroseicoccus oceanibius]QQL43937.1 hypothetical protein G3M56_008505 [Sulfuriroseicoccus oceanibius]
MLNTPAYQVVIHPQVLEKAQRLLTSVQAGTDALGARVGDVLATRTVADLTTIEFLEALVQSKLPVIFAESAVHGDGSDWTQEELSLLGDINISIPVTIFDDGRHSGPDVHTPPITGTLLFTPGALLRSSYGTPADWDEVVRDGKIDQSAFTALYERRLLPLFHHASQSSAANGNDALITIPGLGCGQFAGPFRGQLGAHLEQALVSILERHAADLPHLRAVYFDPYAECSNARREIDHIAFLTRPLTQGNQHKPQLCPPTTYQEPGDDFSRCELFSMVAWDHVSWPGNDFFGGSRCTDDGVKSAATNAMHALTGIEGEYCDITHAYLPPQPHHTWEEVVRAEHLRLKVADRHLVYPSN